MRLLRNRWFVRPMPVVRVAEEHDVMVPLIGAKRVEGLSADETEALAAAAAEALRGEMVEPIDVGHPVHFEGGEAGFKTAD